MSYVALAAAAVSVGTYAYSEYQKSEADKNRPKLDIPKEVTENLTQADQQALQGLPEDQKRQYLESIRKRSAGAMASSQTRKGGLSGIAGMQQQENAAYSNLLSMDAQARAQNQRQLMAARGEMADYKMQKFQVNELNPYYEDIAFDQAQTANLSQNLVSSAGLYGGKSPNTKKTNTSTSSVMQSGINPYSQNVDRMGSYQDPQTDQMFKQQQRSIGSVGTWDNPQTDQMFKQQQANPYAPTPLNMGPNYAQQYNPYY